MEGCKSIFETGVWFLGLLGLGGSLALWGQDYFSHLETILLFFLLASLALFYAIANHARKLEECDISVGMECQFKKATDEGNAEYEIILLVTNTSVTRQIKDVHVTLSDKILEESDNTVFHSKKIGFINPRATEALRALRMTAGIEDGELLYPPPSSEGGKLFTLSFLVSSENFGVRKHRFVVKMKEDEHGMYSPTVHKFVDSAV